MLPCCLRYAVAATSVIITLRLRLITLRCRAAYADALMLYFSLRAIAVDAPSLRYMPLRYADIIFASA